MPLQRPLREGQRGYNMSVHVKNRLKFYGPQLVKQNATASNSDTPPEKAFWKLMTLVCSECLLFIFATFANLETSNLFESDVQSQINKTSL